MLSRNGILQPQTRKLGPVAALVAATTSVEVNNPAGTPNCGQLAKKPFRFALPHSIDISTDPPHSPPTPSPWHVRRTMRITAAEIQICEGVGMSPMRNVAIPIGST